MFDSLGRMFRTAVAGALVGSCALVATNSVMAAESDMAGKKVIFVPIAMGMRYANAFGDGNSPFESGDAYERMLLNTARGEQTLSVSSAELVEAWR